MLPFDVPPPNPIADGGPLTWIVIAVVVLLLAGLIWALIRARRR